MADLDIYLLGRFRVLAGGTEVEEQHWSRKKAKTLLKLLALAPGRKLHREQLIEIFWPDAGSESALNNFHKLIHAARRALEPGLRQGTSSRFLLTQDTQVLLAPAPLVWIDVEEFASAAAAALETRETQALESALARHGGELLEEDLYEDWASIPRERIRFLYQRLLDRLAANLEAGRDERAVEILNRLIAANRVNEDAHRRLMRLYVAAGRRHLALDQYRLCCDALKDELDAAPEPATVQMYESLVAGGVAPEPAPALPRDRRPPESPQPVFARPRRRMMLWAGLGAAVLAILAWRVALRTDFSRLALPSLAILPLAARDGGQHLEYLADGITEALINRSSSLPGIRVMARSTVFAYKGRTDARAVGRELKVSTVLSGRLRQTPEGLEVAAELVDVRDGSRIWGRQFAVAERDLPSVERILSEDAASALHLEVAADGRKGPVTGDAEAYRLYLTGRYQGNKRTAEGLRESIDYYRRAIERDPAYALAYAGLADSYGLLGWEDGLPADYFPRARAAAVKALQLDDRLAEAHTSLAMVLALYEWNWTGAELEFRRSIDLNGGYATAHHWFGVHLGAMGRFEEARAELARALELDPLSPIIALNSGYPLYYQRRYKDARDIYHKALEINPGFPPAHQDLMLVAGQEGNPAEAAREALRFLRASGRTDLANALERAHASGGYRALLRTWLDKEETRSRSEYVSPMTLASLATRLHDRERAFALLDRAYRERSAPLVYVAVDPQYQELSADPRFKDLLRRIGLRPR